MHTERSLMIRRELKKNFEGKLIKRPILNVDMLLANAGGMHFARPQPKSIRCFKCLLYSDKCILHSTTVYEPFALCRILIVGSVMNYFK